MKDQGNLVLSRQAGQTIVIGDGEILVTVLGVRNGKVNLSIRADRSVSVDRLEIWEKKQLEVPQ